MLTVMKVGGSILSTPEDLQRICNVIKSKKGSVLVVTSALKGITDALALELQSSANKKSPKDFIASLKKRHLELLEKVKDSSAKDSAIEKLEEKIAFLKTILVGVSYLGEISPRTRDLIETFGERLSMIVLEAFLLGNKVKAKAFEAQEIGLLTDSRFGRATPLLDRLEANMAFLKDVLKESVVVVPGFYGIDEKGNITCLGRGGSDYSAGAIAFALDADALELWKDVDGFSSADPKIVKEAKLLKELGYDEAEELGYFGAKILHPKTIPPIRRKNIKLLIKNIQKPEADGTVVWKDCKECASVVKSIAALKDVAMVTVKSAEFVDGVGTASALFDAMARADINVDLIATAESSISFTILKKDLEKARQALANLPLAVEKTEVREDISVISVVGDGMKSTPGIAGKVFSTLGSKGINIEMISMGASEINLSLAVKQKDFEKAVQALHDEFGKGAK